MRDDERLFSFAIQFFIITILLVAVFHALFETDAKKLKTKNREIVLIEEDLANTEARFATLVRADTLGPIVAKMFPTWRKIGTGSVISVKNME